MVRQRTHTWEAAVDEFGVPLALDGDDEDEQDEELAAQGWLSAPMAALAADVRVRQLALHLARRQHALRYAVIIAALVAACALLLLAGAVWVAQVLYGWYLAAPDLERVIGFGLILLLGLPAIWGVLVPVSLKQEYRDLEPAPPATLRVRARTPDGRFA